MRLGGVVWLCCVVLKPVQAHGRPGVRGAVCVVWVVFGVGGHGRPSPVIFSLTQSIADTILSYVTCTHTTQVRVLRGPGHPQVHVRTPFGTPCSGLREPSDAIALILTSLLD